MSGPALTRALRFDAARVGGLSQVLAPPYDVISESEAADLRRRHERNVVRLTNPEGLGEERYAKAAETLRAWIADGTLARDERPAAYLHRHRFRADGVEHQRTGLWLLLRLTPFGAGAVMPHEKTMGGPKADRLALMRACRAQLSPIFLISSDSGRGFAESLGRLGVGEPQERAEFPVGESHEIWRIEERGALEAIGAGLGGAVYLIADGHHRYETALAYRDELIVTGAPATGRNAHEFVLAYVVPESDPGLLLLPTHRVMRGAVDWESALEGLGSGYRVRELAEAELGPALAELEERAGQAGFMLLSRGEPGGRLVRFEAVEPAEEIASVVLHERLLEGVLGIGAEEQAQRITYLRDPRQAVERVRSGVADAAALLAAPGVEQVREAAAAGRRLPPKTTYFWPKVPTGIALHLIDPEEEVAPLSSAAG